MSTARNMNPIETSVCNTARTNQTDEDEIEYITAFKRTTNESGKKENFYKNKARNRKTCIK